MFIDVARIYVKAGNGGNGKIAFHREKYVEKGGPSGGNGGKGGDIVFVADSGLNTLIDYKYKKKAIAPNGGDGGIEKMSGRGADNVYLKVPVGTVISPIFGNSITVFLGTVKFHSSSYDGGWPS